MAGQTPHKPVISRLHSLMGHRGRNIANTAAWSLVAKIAAAANLFVSVPFVLRALGPQEFGAWATLVSLVYFAGFLDFGFGNGTMNLIAAARGRGADDEIALILRESQHTLIKVAAGLAAAVLVALPLVPWHHLLGLPVETGGDCRLASAAVLFSIVVAVPLNLANRVQLGLGRGERAFRWQAAGQLLALVLVVVLALMHASLPALTLAAVSTPLLASACHTLSLQRDPALRVPKGMPRQTGIAACIRREGFQFFVMQLAAALAFSTDLPLISALRDPTQAGTYAIVQRLFSIIPLGLSLVWAPLWPTYRHALATGHHTWVASTLRRSVVMAVCVAGVVGAFMVVGFDWITSFWVHRALAVGAPLLIGFAVWSVLEAAGNALSTFLNAASVMRIQMMAACAFATVCVAGKYWAIRHGEITWLPWVTIVAYCFTALLPFAWNWKRIFAEAVAKRF